MVIPSFNTLKLYFSFKFSPFCFKPVKTLQNRFPQNHAVWTLRNFAEPFSTYQYHFSTPIALNFHYKVLHCPLRSHFQKIEDWAPLQRLQLNSVGYPGTFIRSCPLRFQNSCRFQIITKVTAKKCPFFRENSVKISLESLIALSRSFFHTLVRFAVEIDFKYTFWALNSLHFLKTLLRNPIFSRNSPRNPCFS